MKDDLTATIIETNRDVKWICRTLAEMKETDARFEERISALERRQAEAAGAEKRTRNTVAGLSGIIGAACALIVQWLGIG